MPRNREAPVRPNLLGQVPASVLKREERLDFDELSCSDICRGKHLLRNRLERECTRQSRSD